MSTSTEPTLTLTTARLLASAMEEEATRRNLRMVFAIYDQHGNLKVFHRMDGTSSGSIKVAQSKAYTAASLPFPTRVLGEQSQKLPGIPYGAIDGCLPLGGGVPIFFGDSTTTEDEEDNSNTQAHKIHLGGVGVSGATPQIDEEIACFGIYSIEGLCHNVTTDYIPTTAFAAEDLNPPKEIQDLVKIFASGKV